MSVPPPVGVDKNANYGKLGIETGGQYKVSEEKENIISLLNRIRRIPERIKTNK